MAWFGRSASHGGRDTFFSVHGAFHRDVECKEVFRVRRHQPPTQCDRGPDHRGGVSADR